MSDYYIASCIFTAEFPSASLRLREYISERWGIPIIRCCHFNEKYGEYTRSIDPKYRTQWEELPECAPFKAGDRVYTVCHYCTKVLERESKAIELPSVWELILEDRTFKYPDYSGMRATIQDCVLTRDNTDEQRAIRELLKKMNIETVELENNFGKVDYCGNSLYSAIKKRNYRRYNEDGADRETVDRLFEEQRQEQTEYCRRFKTDTVICYCHYCYEGLKLGGMDARHIAELLF